MQLKDFQLIFLSEQYLDLVLKWRNKPTIRSLMYQDELITWKNHIDWFEKNKNSENKLIRLLTYKEDPIGLVNFSNINHTDKRCSWGFYIGEEKAPKGSGTTLAYLALKEIFEKQDMRKVCAEVIEHNTKSLSFHRKIGFIQEGRLLKHIKKEKKLQDVFLMALFNKQWEIINPKLKKQVGG